MALFRMFVSEFQQLQQLQHVAHDNTRREDAARLQRKLWRTEIGLAVIALGAVAMFLDAAAGLFAFTG